MLSEESQGSCCAVREEWMGLGRRVGREAGEDGEGEKGPAATEPYTRGAGSRQEVRGLSVLGAVPGHSLGHSGHTSLPVGHRCSW